MVDVGPGVLWEMFRHAQSWLANLNRASKERKQESQKALRGVITAARQTAVYVRKLEANKDRDFETEAKLAVLWTELAFALEDIGVTKLAKRCHITGKHWSNPEHYSKDFLEKADVSLEKMEGLARGILSDGKKPKQS